MVHDVAAPGSPMRPTTKRRGRRIRRTRLPGSSRTCASSRAGASPTSRPARASSPGCSRRPAPSWSRLEPVAGMRATFRAGSCPASRCSPATAEATAAPRRVRSTRSPSRRRGTGSTTTARSPRPPACCGRAAGRPGVERARPQRSRGSTRCGRSWTGSRSARRGAITRTGATAPSATCPASAQLHDGPVPPRAADHARGRGPAGGVGEPRRGAARTPSASACSTRCASAPGHPPGRAGRRDARRSPTGSTASGSSGA